MKHENKEETERVKLVINISLLVIFLFISPFFTKHSHNLNAIDITTLKGPVSEIKY